MRKSKYTEEQIIGFLKQAEAGMPRCSSLSLSTEWSRSDAGGTTLGLSTARPFGQRSGQPRSNANRALGTCKPAHKLRQGAARSRRGQSRPQLGTGTSHRPRARRPASASALPP